MNRELTKREKTLLLVLVVLVLVLGYCKLFLEPIDRQITSFRTNTDIEQAELDSCAHKAKIIIAKTGERLSFDQYRAEMEGK